MWNKNLIKAGSGKQEIQVKCVVNDLCMCNISADAFLQAFKRDILKIPRSNAYFLEYTYRAEKKDENTIEIWKYKANSDRNYLMYNLTKGPDSPDPFGQLF